MKRRELFGTIVGACSVWLASKLPLRAKHDRYNQQTTSDGIPVRHRIGPGGAWGRAEFYIDGAWRGGDYVLRECAG